ncbi:putative transport protein (MFS superfamily); putative tartrate transporter [Bradyrhizobium sp. ORS 278]|uniref:MFS transporter n=1 Tax=Bradyrhizobium sp. (strain ORS 278) TaxID=114615 RepID=UPI000150897C|nr:MFS transporter [Bradyrhizobium sp. ORS 278]CAL77625.1 putative transport protein (MFS superfamily); putative tartrate transporter [Bradyrhizobium sp. ORS 278]
MAEAAAAPSALERTTMRRVSWRIMPFMMICYLFAILDRGNVGMASLQMVHDLGMSKAVFGFGASLFFFSYFLMEVPSNLALQRFGARRWIARIMITWGIISAGMAFVQGQNSFYVMRFLLGAAEAGFFPGVLLYLTYWLPANYRGRLIALFGISIPAASFIGSPLGGLLLDLDGLLGLRGWQWLFIVEGVPTVLLGLVCLAILTDRPEEARWLRDDERSWLCNELNRERAGRPSAAAKTGWGSFLQLLRNPVVWAMALACSGASAAGSVLGVWQPQFLKSFGLTNLETGLINSIPYGVACVLMVLWGRHSDKTGERRWHTALTLLLIAFGFLGVFVIHSLMGTVILLSLVLVGAYAFKGPFWALSSGWLGAGSVAAGLAMINAVSNLIGGGLMVNIYGSVLDATGNYGLALLPIAIVTTIGAGLVLVISRPRSADTAILAATKEA